MFPLLPAYLLAITIDDPKVRELCPNGMITTKKEYALSSSTPFLCLYGNYVFMVIMPLLQKADIDLKQLIYIIQVQVVLDKIIC